MVVVVRFDFKSFVLVFGLVGGGFLIGFSQHKASKESAGTTASSPAGQLSVPDDWELAPPPRTLIATPKAGRPLVLRPKGDKDSGARLVAGLAPVTGPSLVAPELLARIDRRGLRPEAVRLGRYEAYRYPNVRLPGSAASRIALYAVPTSDGVATFACLARAGQMRGVQPGCEGIAKTLVLHAHTRAYPLGDLAVYERRLRGAMVSFDAVRVRQRGRLHAAETPTGQARAAAAISAAAGRTAGLVDPGAGTPAVRSAGQALALALRRIADAYTALARAARHHQRASFALAALRVEIAEGTLAMALGRLEPPTVQNGASPATSSHLPPSPGGPCVEDAKLNPAPGLVTVCATADGASLTIENVSSGALRVSPVGRAWRSAHPSSAPASLTTAAIRRVVRYPCSETVCTVPPDGSVQVAGQPPLRVSVDSALGYTLSTSLLTSVAGVVEDRVLPKRLKLGKQGEECVENGSSLTTQQQSAQTWTALAKATQACGSFANDLWDIGKDKESQATERASQRFVGYLKRLASGFFSDGVLAVVKTVR